MTNSESQQSAPSPVSLQRLAEAGLANLPAERLLEVAEEAWSWGEATGDARYCLLWRMLHMINGWFGEGEGGALAAPVVEHIDDTIMRELPGVLNAQSPEEGTVLAATLREHLVAEMTWAGDPLHPSYGY